MRLRIAGIVHNDLIGRERLLNWLLQIKDVEKVPPFFAAVEYDETMFRKIREQGSVLRRLAAEAWPDSSQEVLKVVEDSLGYEGDLHECVFPGIETVWLDQGRTVKDSTILSQYAHHRLEIYKSFFPSVEMGLSNGSLKTMSSIAWERGSPPRPGGSDRDEKFAQVIIHRLQRESWGWAIAIVGSIHASEVEGSMLSRLKDEGIECQMSQLWPQT